MATPTKHEGKGPKKIPEQKDPDAIWDFSIIWGDWLGDDTASSFDASAVGVTLDSRTTFASATIDGVVYSDVEVLRISGGTAGDTATISSKCTTATGLIDERSALITIAEQ